MIKLKRVYEAPAPSDGVRILVERLWPRGIKKQSLEFDEWLKDVAPSTELRRWFGHDPARWKGFRDRYRAELTRSGQIDALKELTRLSRRKTVTLVYSAADETHNQAVALKAFLDEI